MRVLYDNDKERLSEMPDRSQRSVYILLKYWKNKPNKWNKLWNELRLVYNDDSDWEYLIANSLNGKGLDWIGGEYQIDKDTGDAHLLNPDKTWETSTLGKIHIINNFYELDYKLSKKEKRQLWSFVITTIIAIVALLISFLAYYHPRKTDDNKEILLQRMDSLQQRLLKLEQNTQKKEMEISNDHHVDTSITNNSPEDNDLETNYQ